MSSSPGEISLDRVPNLSKRQAMNTILILSVGVSALGLAAPYLSFFVPPSESNGGAGGRAIAKDALGNVVTVASWKETHQADTRELVQGLKGDPTYLILNENKIFADYALNAICTHMGCVVPWNKAENKFM